MIYARVAETGVHRSGKLLKPGVGPGPPSRDYWSAPLPGSLGDDGGDARDRVPKEETDKGFTSTFFLMPNAHPRKWRPILTLCPLNHFIWPKRFRMESLHTALQAMPLPAWVALLDHVPVGDLHYRYLRILYNGITYEFRSLPFSLSMALRLFTRLVKVMARILRHRNVKIFVYQDDWLVGGQQT